MNPVSFTMDAVEFQRALKLAAGSVKEMNAMPATGCVRVDTVANWVKMRSVSGTDSSSVAFPAPSDNDASFLMDADIVQKVAALLDPEANVTIESDGEGRVRIVQGFNEHNLLSLPVEGWPDGAFVETPFDKQVDVEVPFVPFMTAMDNCSVALPVKEHRRVLLGINIALKTDGTMILAATDGKKLVQMHLAFKGTVPAEVNYTVPIELLQYLKRVYSVDKGKAETLFMKFLEKFVVVNTGHSHSFAVNYIDGKYPDVSAVIPKGPFQLLTMDRKAFLGAVKRAIPTSDTKSKAVVFSIAEDAVKIASSSHDVGQFSGSVKPLNYIGNPIELAFNDKFLCEILNLFDCNNIRLAIKSSNAPVLFQNADEGKSTNDVHLLMPIKQADVKKAEPEYQHEG